jgi:YfiH family protein
MSNLEIHEDRGVEYLLSPLLGECGFLRHAFSTRRGGVSEAPFRSLNLGKAQGEDPESVGENRRRFFEVAGMRPRNVAEVRQVHGADVVEADEIPGDGDIQADGIMTDEPGVFVAVQTADCVPVLLADPVNRAVAAVHAGRRGTEEGVLENAVRRMRERYSTEAKNLAASLGPGISGQCYEVGAECIPPFRRRYPDWRDICMQVSGEKWLLDLPKAVNLQLRSAGVPGERIDAAPFCTFSEAARFFSYRRDGEPTGRLLSVIGIV